jgi:hypothetical protein
LPNGKSLGALPYPNDLVCVRLCSLGNETATLLDITIF